MIKKDIFSYISQQLLKFTFINKENLEKIIEDLFNEANNMSKREKEKCNGMLIISQLYY